MTAFLCLILGLIVGWGIGVWQTTKETVQQYIRTRVDKEKPL